MDELFNHSTQHSQGIDLGNDFSVEFNIYRTKANVFNGTKLHKEILIRNKPDLRHLLVDLVSLGAKKSRIASAFQISRQSLDNYIAAKEKWGLQGLIDSPKNINGVKAEILLQERKEAKEKAEKEKESGPTQLPLAFFFDENKAEEINTEEQPYQKEHGWKKSRYLGHFTYIIILASQWNWFALTQGFFGKGYQMLMVLLFMSAENIRSIEGLKNVRSEEVGLLLGIDKLPSKPKIWQAFAEICSEGNAGKMLKEYFSYQIKAGLVSIWLWAIDGHLLPYTGKRKVHYAYNTQRQMPVPGRTVQVTTDAQGRIVDYCLEEGKGNMKDNIVDVATRWREKHGINPIFIFDREAYSAEYFHKLIAENISFVTWQKNVSKDVLSIIPDDKYAEKFEFNDKEYAAFEEPYTMNYKVDNGEQQSFSLRKIFLWNKTANRRTCCMAWTKDEVSTQEASECILTRWAASENTFKHMQERHQLNYTPGFKFVESTRQDIANPALKKIQQVIAKVTQIVQKLKVKLGETEEKRNSDSSVRKNSKRDRILSELTAKEKELNLLREEKKEMPERIDISGLEDYRSFEKIDNEGKSLFDFSLTSVWNARKMMVNWLKDFYENDNEVVDLFYAITKCHGFIKVTPTHVLVSLEPLEQPSRRAAQRSLCMKLSSLNAMLPSGKLLQIGVDAHRGLATKFDKLEEKHTQKPFKTK